MFRWPVVPICDKQLRDVNEDDIIANGIFRRCNTYKGGGGYDRFPAIFERRFGEQVIPLNDQFVVQLRGCPLHCPYCYVTREGIDGKPVLMDTAALVSAYRESRCSVFHLMGGAPAIYLEYWPELLRRLGDDVVFHSDLLLVEKVYDADVICALASRENSLYAVSIKGAGTGEFELNTKTKLDERLFWGNLDKVVESGLPFYFTFTGMSDDSVKKMCGRLSARYGAGVLADSFSVSIIEYEALK